MENDVQVVNEVCGMVISEQKIKTLGNILENKMVS